MINADFNDVRTIMSEGGSALMAVGHGKGDNRAVDAAKAAISSPLLDVTIQGARGVLFNVTAGRDLGLSEVDAAAQIIKATADPQANIIFGVVINEEMSDTMQITLIATGFDATPKVVAKPKVATVAGQPVTADDKSGKVPLRVFDSDDLDIPTFLRNRRTS
jgi:cell division protein FtsZ